MKKELVKFREEYLKMSEEERTKRWEEFYNIKSPYSKEELDAMAKELNVLRGRG